MIKMGYKRIKEKVKNIRQDYSKAVVSCTRSGGGKIVFAHYDDLSTIWGGSPSTEVLPYGVDSQSPMSSINLEPESTDEVRISSCSTPLHGESIIVCLNPIFNASIF